MKYKLKNYGFGTPYKDSNSTCIRILTENDFQNENDINMLVKLYILNTVFCDSSVNNM